MMIHTFRLFCTCFIFFVLSCQSDSGKDIEQGFDSSFIKKTSQETGIDFRNDINDNIGDRYNVLSFQYLFNGGGVGVADINNDGLEDIYFTGNMVDDRLYLNQGDFSFKDITNSAGMTSKQWSNGVSFTDINNDGYLDIYVCQGGPELSKDKRRNKLYINQQNLTFKEEAAQYGLNDGGISTQAAFFDFDKDGDQDCVVMNNAVYNPSDFFGNLERIKNVPGFLPDNSVVLYENINGKFNNISEPSGVQKFSFGLGLLIQDFNDDSFPDIYIANDYYLPDYLFINNTDGTFSEQIKRYSQQSTFFSMGIDAADVNNDALVDFAVLDMSSADHIRDKTLMPSMNVNLFYTLIAHFGYQRQYMFNTLQINNGNGSFSNLAHMAGLAKSDWSWSLLWADFDLDGWQDCHITNGIKKYLNDNDFRRRIKKLDSKSKAGIQITSQDKRDLYASIPEMETRNLVYENNRDLTFTNRSKEWSLDEATNSNGAAYADLDNDGDLDLITNNLDEYASVYENTFRNGNHFIGIDLNYDKTNTKVEVFVNGKSQSKEYHPVRGYQSSQDHRLVFGLGTATVVDSIMIEWQNGSISKIEDINANQYIKPTPSKASAPKTIKHKIEPYFSRVNPESIGINFQHKENIYNDYKTETLLPYMQSTLGPKITTADINNDGLDDFYVGGARGQSGSLYLQLAEERFRLINGPWSLDAESEDLGSLFFDADNDGDLDLYVCSAGNSFQANAPTLQDRLYLNQGGAKFSKSNTLPLSFTTSSCVAAGDIDGDGDLDLFVGGRHQQQKYPIAEPSRILLNDNGTFTVAQQSIADFSSLGLVNDAVWADINDDTQLDLIIATEWGPIHIYENENGSLIERNQAWKTSEEHGMWMSLIPLDWDNDGDTDFVAGNIGLNSKFKADHHTPLKLFAGDFDNNGTHDVFLSKMYNDKYVPVRGFECSSGQMPILASQFGSYKDFASADIDQVLNIAANQNHNTLHLTRLESGIFINEGGYFVFKSLPKQSQTSPLFAGIPLDINTDGNTDLLHAGNIYHTEPETPSLDAFSLSLLLKDNQTQFTRAKPQESGFVHLADIKDLGKIKTKDGLLIIVCANNAQATIYKSAF